MSALRRFLALGGAERAVAAEAAALLAFVRLTFWILPFRLLRRALHRYSTLLIQTGGRVAAARTAALVASVAARFPVPVTCLAEALVAETMLRRRGYAPALRLGVRKPDASVFDAHAWVECDGRIVIGEVAELGDYAVLEARGRS